MRPKMAPARGRCRSLNWWAVSVLAAFGRILARTAREAAQAGVLPRDLRQDLTRSRALVADVERCMHEFAQAALVTWESRHD